ncbi:MAG: hypothetical protein ABFS23_01055 [Pseudomonadota bacterium]
MRVETHENIIPHPIRHLTMGLRRAGRQKDGDESRFAAPWRLNDTQKKAIAAILEELGIGDRESRTLFIGAMEYELAAYQESDSGQAPELSELEPSELASSQEVTAPESARTAIESGYAEVDREALRVIAGTAQDLAALIRDMPGKLRDGLLESLATQDEMRRDYSQRYLDQLNTEITRVVSACAMQILTTGEKHIAVAEEPASPPPAYTEAHVRLVGTLANVFEECFEEAPTTDTQGDFAEALNAIAVGTGIPLPISRELLEIALLPTLG